MIELLCLTRPVIVFTLEPWHSQLAHGAMHMLQNATVSLTTSWRSLSTANLHSTQTLTIKIGFFRKKARGREYNANSNSDREARAAHAHSRSDGAGMQMLSGCTLEGRCAGMFNVHFHRQKRFCKLTHQEGQLLQ